MPSIQIKLETPLEVCTNVTSDISACIQRKVWGKWHVIDAGDTWPSLKEKPILWLDVPRNIDNLHYAERTM